MTCPKCKKDSPVQAVFCMYCGSPMSAPVRHRTRRGNGLGTAYKDSGRGNWIAEITVGYTADGKRKSRRKYGFPTKKAALEALHDLVNAPDSPKPVTLTEYYDSWLASDAPKLSSSKQIAYKIAWKRLEALHSVPVSKLSVILLRDAVNEQCDTFYPARDCKSLLSHLCKLAIADGQLQSNPSQYITLPELSESKRVAWTSQDLAIMWRDHANGIPMASYLLLMTYTGMMPGELWSCRKSMIHWDEHTIVGAGLKTDVRKAVPIVLADIVIPVLRTVCGFTPDEPDQCLADQIRSEFYESYHKYLQQSGLPDRPMYTCRHTTATALAVGTDVSPSIIQQVMRHAKFTTTERYIHPDVSDALNAVNKLNGSPAE